MRRLDDWIKAYLRYTQNNEAPEHFHFWVAVSVIGAALRRKAYFNMGDWQWSPNFYIIFVAPPAIVNKSTTMRIGKKLLTENEAIQIGPSSLTWQALIEAFQHAQEDVVMPDGMLTPMSCLTFFISEFGTFMDFADKKLVDVLVDMWDGDASTWERATQSRGREGAVNPWINIMAGTTPAWLADNLPRKMIEGGFSSRCIWVQGDKKKAYIPYPTRHPTMEGREELRNDLVHDLMQIARMAGEFRLTEEAYEFGEQWYHQHCIKMEAFAYSMKGMGGYYARKQAHVHKLAMVLAAAKCNTMVIERDELEAAVKILDANEQGYGQVFQSIVTTVTTEQTIDLIRIVASKKQVRKSELYQLVFRNMNGVKEFNEALESAATAGYLAYKQEGNTLFIVPGPQIRSFYDAHDKDSSIDE